MDKYFWTCKSPKVDKEIGTEGVCCMDLNTGIKFGCQSRVKIYISKLWENSN